MPVNKEYLRESLTFIFGSCDLTDEFIDEIDNTCYSGIDTICACQRYMRDELKIPYCDEFLKQCEEEGFDPYQKVNLNWDSGIKPPDDFV